MANINVPFLPTIKCSNCHIHIDVRRLDHHICANYEKAQQHQPKLIESNIHKQPLTPPSPIIQRRSREKSHGLNNSMRRIFQKIKGNNSSNNDNSLISPTSSTLSSSTTTSSLLTPRSSEDYFQQYLLKQDMEFFSSQKNIVRPKSRDRSHSHRTTNNQQPSEEENDRNLDNMIEEFIVKMNNKGIKDVCFACSQSIGEDVIKKDEKCYHKVCYCCSLCRIPLSLSNGFEFYNGKMYCERDYQVMKSRYITANSLSPKSAATTLAIQKSCYRCNMTVENTDYKTFKNRIYCKSDFKDLFLPKCRGCKKAVENEAISAMDGKLEGKWHIECFNCQTCHRPFPDNRFYVYENLPYCKIHYHELNNSLCKSCFGPIEGLCAYIPDHDWRFHPNCFSCQLCQERLDDAYYVFEGRIYCETHIKRQYHQKDLNITKRSTQIFNI